MAAGRASSSIVHHSTQVPHLVRVQLAESLGIDEGEVRVITCDVGGGFGLKLGIYPEDVLACLHARDTRRPGEMGPRTAWSTSALRRTRRESVHDVAHRRERRRNGSSR